MQQSSAAETLECTREHAHNKVLVDPRGYPLVVRAIF